MTAMMKQYHEIKESLKKEHCGESGRSSRPECLLFFRLGDFYELFYDDAITASRELDIALTGRDCGEAERAPMCGVPHHAVDGYIATLVEKGYHVAVCEQMETPKPGSKTPVRREVVRIITPGTITDNHMLEEGKNNYILSLHIVGNRCALAAADITTGTFTTTHFIVEEESNGHDQIRTRIHKRIIDEIARFNPAEILINEDFPKGIRTNTDTSTDAGFVAGTGIDSAISAAFHIKPHILPSWNFGTDFAYKSLCHHFNTLHLEGFGLRDNAPEIPACGALITYLQETQKGALSQITSLVTYEQSKFLIMDRNTRQNLELTATLRPWRRSSAENKSYTLLGVLDHTCTSMGARLIRSWVEMPLVDIPAITARQDAVGEWVANAFLRVELRDSLNGIHDMERLITRISGINVNGRDVSALRASLGILPFIKEKLWETKAPLNASMYRNFDDMRDIHSMLENALLDEPSVSIREGGLIKRGYNEELDQLLSVKENGDMWLSELEGREQLSTGIKSLKVRYNRIFGYFIEVTRSNIGSVPENYIRKQTLANSERYTTPELDNLAESILNAGEKQKELEFNLFQELRNAIMNNIERVQFMAQMIASLDALQSLGEAADRNNYCKPTVNDGETVYIQNGRHPVIEQNMPFVPNDTHLNGSDRRMAVITGPNMAGKSTYMRQVALISLMAQIGSFVPADDANIGIVDRIFTRVGASDDLAGGQSTFMVEMTEVAHILNHATRKSLIVLDEIGRGTSTYDGLSIAWAVLEYIADPECIGAKTLFATHYHELTVMEERIPGVLNYSFKLMESGEDSVDKDNSDEASTDGTDEASGKGSAVSFLRKLQRGGADKSYGIQVAKLAGVPHPVLKRARRVLLTLEAAGSFIKTEDIEPPQAVFFNEDMIDGKVLTESEVTKNDPTAG